MTDSEKIAQIRTWAEELVNCSHRLCSMAESVYEEKFGQEILDILNEKVVYYRKDR